MVARKSVLRNTDPDLPRGDLLHGVGFVENDEIIREKITALAFLLFLGTAEQHEEERVIDDDHVRGEQSLARLLKETFGRLAAGLGRADVGLAANLRPDFRVGLDRQIAERSVLRGPRPIGDALQLSLLRGGKKLVRLLQGALETPRAKIILPAFHERGLELDRQNFLQDRNVLVEQLLLKIDRVRGDDRLLLLLDGEKNRGNEVGDRLAHAGPGFDTRWLFLQAPAPPRPPSPAVRRRYSKFFAFARRPSFEKIVRIRSTKSLPRISLSAIMSKLRLPICDLRFVYEPLTPRASVCPGRKIEPIKIRKSVKLLDRYVLRNFLQAYIYCIAGFISIWLIFDISDNISTFHRSAPFALRWCAILPDPGPANPGHSFAGGALASGAFV